MAIAGFAGVVFALRGGTEGLSLIARIRLWRLIETSLSTSLFALLPLAFHHLGLGAAELWGLSSALFAVWVIGAYALMIRRVWKVDSERWPWVFNIVLLACLVVAVSALTLNALGIGFERGFGVYFAALLAYLVLAGLVFARLLLARN